MKGLVLGHRAGRRGPLHGVFISIGQRPRDGRPLCDAVEAILEGARQGGKRQYLSVANDILMHVACVYHDDRPDTPVGMKHGLKLGRILDSIKWYVEHSGGGGEHSEAEHRQRLVQQLRGYADQLEADLATTTKL